jgi:aryl-alcohol dehydrogenase-like predicted oxidoreductase
MSTRLGQSDTHISSIGAGTIAWGDPRRGFGTGFNRTDTAAATAYLLEHGCNFLDTAEVYGSRGIQSGEGAEQLLGDALAAAPGGGAVVGTKYFPLPWTAVVGVGGGARLGRRAVIEALRRSLTRLGLGSVDLLYLHFPLPVPGLMDAMADCVDAGLVAHIGVSNHSVKQLRAAHAALRARGIDLAANQFRFHLLDRGAEASGLLEETLRLGATPVAYEPYARRLLTGKLTDGEVSPGREYTTAQLKLVKGLCSLMKFVAATSGATPRSVPQVALAYCVAKGLVPVPGVKTEGQARDVVGAMGWGLDRETVGLLEEKSDYVLRMRR